MYSSRYTTICSEILKSRRPSLVLGVGRGRRMTGTKVPLVNARRNLHFFHYVLLKETVHTERRHSIVRDLTLRPFGRHLGLSSEGRMLHLSKFNLEAHFRRINLLKDSGVTTEERVCFRRCLLTYKSGLHHRNSLSEVSLHFILVQSSGT